MAVINYKGEDNPSEKNRFGTVSGVDLKTPPILNLNPLDIEYVNHFIKDLITRNKKLKEQVMRDIFRKKNFFYRYIYKFL